MKNLKEHINQCTTCAPFFKHQPRPVCTFHSNSKIVIIGQAPGTKVHLSGIPWNDKSGENLRNWMGIDSETFYNEKLISIVPMGFCYPGKGKTGDLPPRKECAPKWHPEIFKQLKNVELVLLVGKYAQDYYLKETKKRTLTETVLNYKEYMPNYFVLPHPSPRNNIWMKKNEWFKYEVIPSLQEIIKRISHNN
ncbi:uracil-DNA glycosylase family protein [Pseudofulvibacter geojedonensis]|uniref:Uracil-DNA glycosylase family protein n=1 Tax=Pseudofulvibacter geojedonensis TaxID=1123758 RepID=A0ABW3I2M4_9FLAO